MYKKILAGYDGSDRAMRAVEEAVDLAGAIGATLYLVSAVDKKNEVREFGESGDRIFLSEVQVAEENLTKIAASHPSVDIKIQAVPGTNPAKVLLDQANEHDIDLILVGNRHVQGVSRVLGSVAEDIAHKAPCAVLIAKTG